MFGDNESLLQQILSIIESIQNLGTDALEYAQNTNPQVLEIVDLIANYAVKPLASVMFSMFAVMQFYKAVAYLNDIGAPQGGSVRFETLGLTLGKIGFIYWVITSMSNFMWGLVAAGNWLMAKVQFYGNYKGQQDFTELEERVREILNKQNFFERFFDASNVNDSMKVISLLVTACGLIVFVLFYARLLQIFVMVALSPIPIVTLIHDEHKQIGISFIKSFCAVVLQGAVMVAMIYIYSHVITYSMRGAENLVSMVWYAAGYAVLLVVALATSGVLSRKIVNAI